MSGSRNASRRSAAGSGCWRWRRRSNPTIARRCPIPHRGTWHAGPFFTAPEMDFLNLELSDTNEADHVNCHLARDHGVSFRFEV